MKTVSTVRKDIEQQDKEFEAAFARGDLANLAELYAEDAALLQPDSDMLQERAAIQQFWQEVRDSRIRAVALHTQDVQASGDRAAEIATAELTNRGTDGGTSTIPVKYVVVWKRQATGTWQQAVDIWNSTPAA